MAEADSVPSANQALITGATTDPFTKGVLPIGRYFVNQANTDPVSGWALGYATAVLLLACYPWNALLILLLLLCRSVRRGVSV